MHFEITVYAQIFAILSPVWRQPKPDILSAPLLLSSLPPRPMVPVSLVSPGPTVRRPQPALCHLTGPQVGGGRGTMLTISFRGLEEHFPYIGIWSPEPGRQEGKLFEVSVSLPRPPVPCVWRGVVPKSAGATSSPLPGYLSGGGTL